ncbi:MAG: DNA primase [Acidobacteriota bacterium]
MARGDVRLTPALVQAVRDAIDVVDIAGDLTSPKRRGRKYVALCPFHKEKTPSFQIDPDLGLFHCFGCGAGGDAIDLYMRGSGDDFPAAIEALAMRYAIPIERQEVDAAQLSRRRQVGEALEAADRLFRRALARSDFARGYLDRREISEALRDRFSLGYAVDGWHGLLDALRRDIGEEPLLEAGLVARSERTGKLYDRFRQRLMFPIHSASGKLVGFGGRTLGDDRAKYVNTAETDAFHKSELLYGLHLAKRTLRDSGRAVLAEGYFDVIGLVASGIEGAVAGMGTALTAEQAKLLARYCDEVVLAYDGDSAGETAARRAVPLLLAAGLGVRRAAFPPGQDPDSLRLEAGPDSVRERIEAATDAVWEEIERAAGDGGLDPRAEVAAAAAIRELLQPMRDPMLRAAYARRAAQRLGLPEEQMLRAARRRAEAPVAAQATSGSTRSEEERAILQLVSPTEPLPPAEAMPREEIFFDPAIRNIYATFCALYRSGTRAPTAREVLDRLADDRHLLDQAARLLLEEAVREEGRLEDSLLRLENRWRKRRQAEIQREIGRAEALGDSTRLIELLEEKKLLSRRLHPGMTGRLW